MCIRDSYSTSGFDTAVQAVYVIAAAHTASTRSVSHFACLHGLSSEYFGFYAAGTAAGLGTRSKLGGFCRYWQCSGAMYNRERYVNKQASLSIFTFTGQLQLSFYCITVYSASSKSYLPGIISSLQHTDG